MQMPAMPGGLGEPQMPWKFAMFTGPQTEIQDDAVDVRRVDSDPFNPVPGPKRSSFFILKEKNTFRQAFNAALSIFLLHTGTIMPYRLCFIDYHVPNPLPQSTFYQAMEMVVEVFWVVDLVINFLFSYRDRKNEEVCDARSVFLAYARGLFLPNLVACTPEVMVEWILKGLGTNASNAEMNKAVRLLRLQRMSRLARLLRLGNVIEFLDKTCGSRARWWKELKGSRLVRIGNFTVALLWIVHLFGCGWYLVAALHEDVTVTWVARRTDPDGTPLLDKAPIEQWVHSCYFVLTVFTTVGFGDISAFTVGEIMYVSVTMLVGAVVNGMIVSDTIAMITSIDESEAEAKRRKDLLVHFAKHTHLSEDVEEMLSEKVVYNMETSQSYDKQALRNLFINGMIPRAVMEFLPNELFDGQLLRNNFVRVCLSKTSQLPPRFPLLLAISIVEHAYVQGDIVYSIFDHPFNVFLVLSGTFAYIDRPDEDEEDGTVTSRSEGRAKGDMLGLPVFAAAAGVMGAMGALHQTSFFGAPGNNPKDLKSVSKNGDARKSKGRPRFPLPLLRERTPSEVEGKKHDCATSDIRFAGHRPMQLFSRWSYFGDVEVMHASPRLSTVRCETLEGCVLMLAKKDIDALMQEFPHLTAAWKVAAYRRKGMHEAVLARSKRRANSTYKTLAASIIQEKYRIYKGIMAGYTPVAANGLDASCQNVRDSKVLLEVANTLSPNNNRDHLPSFVDPTVASLSAEWSIRDIHKLRSEMHCAFEAVHGMQVAMQRYVVDTMSELRSDLGLAQSKLSVNYEI